MSCAMRRSVGATRSWFGFSSAAVPLGATRTNWFGFGFGYGFRFG